MRACVGGTETVFEYFVHARTTKRAIKAKRGGMSQGGATVFTSGIGPGAIGQEWRNLSTAAVAVLSRVDWKLGVAWWLVRDFWTVATQVSTEV